MTRDFRRLWAAQTTSMFGSLITRAALPFTAVLWLHATAWQMSVLAMADVVSHLVVSPFAGVWADRLRRRPLLIATDVARAVLLGSVPVAYLFGVLRFPHLVVVMFASGACTVVFEVAHQAYVPLLVAREELMQANARLLATAAVAETAAFGLAGWLVQALSGPIAVAIDALSFVASALLLVQIRTPEPARVEVPHSDAAAQWREMTEGVRVVWDSVPLRAMAVSTMLLMASFSIFRTCYMLYLTSLGFRPGVLGMVFAVGGVSSFFGATLTRRASERFGVGTVMIGGLLACTAGFALIPVAYDAGWLSLGLLIAQQLIGDGGITAYDLTQVSVRQTLVDESRLGRVGAGVRLLQAVAQLAGAGFAGWMGSAFGTRWAMASAAGLLALAALWLASTPVRRLGRMATLRA